MPDAKRGRLEPHAAPPPYDTLIWAYSPILPCLPKLLKETSWGLVKSVEAQFLIALSNLQRSSLTFWELCHLAFFVEN